MRPVLGFVLASLIACDRPGAAASRPPVTVFAAASLARPLALIADSFLVHSRVATKAELGGSLEHARKLTELGRTPDVLLLVDEDVMASLMPAYVDWYVRFGTNRLVVAYTAKSRHADSITSENWWRTLARPGVTIGRADPAVAPVGRHALALLRRAGSYYRTPDLGNRLLEHAATRYMRPNASELAALLETGEVDYIIDYASVAEQYGFSFIRLPEDLATPVLYSVSVPRAAPHFAEGVELVSFMLSDEGRRILRRAHVNVLGTPVAVGSVVPLEISSIARTAPAAVAPATR